MNQDLSAAEIRNGNYYLWATLMNYLAAPVFYVGVAQAALFNKLGASATVANLPTTANLVGCFVPVVFACFIPLRWEKGAMVAANALMGVLMLAIGVILILPLDNEVRIVAVILQCLVLGMLNSISQVFLLQCLRRGTSELGRARALKYAYFFGPMAAVAGSLLGQFVLQGGIRALVFPRDFAVLHLIAVPCAAVTTWCCSRMAVPPAEEVPRASFFAQLWANFAEFGKSRDMRLLWVAYLCWYVTLYIMPTLSLYSKTAVGLDTAALAGIFLAIRFGSKSISGFFLGNINMRFGTRAPLIATLGYLGVAVAWALVAPGYAFLISFALLGAGELGGTYYPNAVLAWAPPAVSTRHLAVLYLVTACASPAPAWYGFLADHWGFHASFAFAILVAIVGLIIVFRLPARRQENP